MNILIINNGTKHITALKHMLQKHTLTIEKYDRIHPLSANYDLVILSGSSLYSVTENPEKYKEEIHIIKSNTIPIIGICLGCELIAYVYGATLLKLPEREHVLTKIQILKNVFGLKKNIFSAYEAHEWAIKNLSNNIIAYAKSKDGYEIIKIKNKNIWGLQFHPEMLRSKIKGFQVFTQIVKLTEKNKWH